MRLTKKMPDGSYVVADWIEDKDSPEFIDQLIQRLGMFDDFEEVHIKTLVDIDSHKRQSYAEGFAAGCDAVSSKGQCSINGKVNAIYHNGVSFGRAQMQSEFRELLGLDD